MRGPLGAAVAAALLVSVGACSSTDDPAASDDRTSEPAPDPAPDQVPGGEPSVSDLYDTATCEAVRDGIDSFNQGDYPGTVDHFEDAVRLAPKDDDGTDDADLLRRAVRYYADLAPDDYLVESTRSDEFARWKVVTLGLCDSTGREPAQPPPPTESDPGTPT